MNNKWTWIGRYVLVLIIALVLGGLLGELVLFKQSTLGSPKFTAASVARFLGYGGALLLFWLFGQRAAEQFRTTGGKTEFLGFVVLPLVTLVVVAAGYEVLLIVLRPFLSPALLNIYNWLFVLGITVSAVWVIVAFFQHSEPMIELLKSSRTALEGNEAGAPCKACGASVASGANFCAKCGAAVAR